MCFRATISTFATLAFLVACGGGGGSKPGDMDGGVDDGSFKCTSNDSVACIDGVHYSCESAGAEGLGLKVKTEDCEAKGLSCFSDLGCKLCMPDLLGCNEGNVARCKSDGSAWDLVEECDPEKTLVCYTGQCQDPCEVAVAQSSYLGCDFFAADLDNAALEDGKDASSQQFAVVISNPNPVAATVTIERNDAPYGEEPNIVTVETRVVAAGDLEVFELERREVDGSSSNRQCTVDGDACPGSEVCVCLDEEQTLCRCRRSPTASGLNDGTHSALSSQAYRLRSTWPLIAYQFNPLSNVGVFSNDASLLIPVAAVAKDYTVIGWPQTIANDDVNPDHDFIHGVSDEDLRATLTIVGTKAQTDVKVTLGPKVVRVVSPSGSGMLGPGESVDVTLGPFDVLNLETQGFNADFTGSSIRASEPVSVFTGNEASDAPRFDSYANRRCCADHLEEQLFPNSTLGRRFFVARMPPRTVALNQAFVTPDSVTEVNEVESVRVVGTTSEPAMITTTLDPPWDSFTLARNEDAILPAPRDFILEASRAVAVLQVVSSQEAVGIPNRYPGGDPAMVAVPPSEQFRKEYVFLTPDKYAFDFVTITAPSKAKVVLDGESVDALLGPKAASGPACEKSPADGIPREKGDPDPEFVIYRCQLSFPDVSANGQLATVDEGEQNDGVHTVVASRAVGIVVYGFDAFVSYAYVGGLDFSPIN